MSLPARYGHAIVGRSGLGNLLLPWARCEVFCHTNHLPMLAPQWSAPKIGPLLRGERDLRFYVGLFNNKSYIRGLRKWFILYRSHRIPETHSQSLFEASEPAVVIFEGLGEFFKPLLAHQPYLAERLYNILSDKSRQSLEHHRV